MSDVNLQHVAVLAELNRYGVSYDFTSGDEVKILCPFHDDHSPSCCVNTVKREFKCHSSGCEQGGDFVTLLAAISKHSRATIVEDLSLRYDIKEEKSVDILAIERWHEAIWSCDALRNELYRRGLTDAHIRKYRLGVQTGKESRITIPIHTRSNVYVNVRRYLPGAPEKKFINARGFGSKPRLFPIEQMSYDTIVVCGGECKAIVAIDYCNPHNIGAISGTWGEENIPVDLLSEFQGKKVYVCMDVDTAGKAAAKKWAQSLRLVAAWVGIVALPLDPDVTPKGDVNDLVAMGRGDELITAIMAAPEFIPDIADKLSEDKSDPIEFALSAAIHADNTAKRLRVKGVVSTMDTTPYIVPKDIAVGCPKGQAICSVCPVAVKRRNTFTIPPTSSAILDFVDSSTDAHSRVLKAAIGIPATCHVCEFERLTEYNVEDTYISPALAVSSRSPDRQPVRALCIGTGLALNETYEFVGKLYANPKSQQATLLVSEHRPTKDSLTDYSTADAEALTAFWPESWSVDDIGRKLREIYTDFAANVTFIRQRQDLHLACDLLYHSPLLINFDKQDEKGWIELLIMGDTRTGKSWCSKKLSEHYALGTIIDGTNCTPAGIIGGMEKIGDRWFVSWGALPNSDQRLLWIEEFADVPDAVISQIREARYSGEAKITKIGRKWITLCRTRLGIISNCENGLPIASYAHGVHAIKDLIGDTPDISRFDLAVLTSSNDVDMDDIYVRSDDREIVQHKYTAELCNKLVLWAWTRARHQVQFTDEAVTAIYDLSKTLATEFSDAIPLIDGGSMRFKLARLSASLAARLFSCSEDYESIVVHHTHAEYITKYLREMYSQPSFGYSSFSRAQQLQTKVIEPEKVKAQILSVEMPLAFIRMLLGQDFIEATDISLWGANTGAVINETLSLFCLTHCLIRRGRNYRKTPAFNALLKQLETELADGTIEPIKEKEKF